MKFKDILIKIKNWIIKFRYELIIVIAAIALDQISKTIISSTMRVGESVTLIPKFLNITYTLNNGAAFSILEGQTWFFILLPSIASIVFLSMLFYKKSNSKLFIIGLAMIAGGTMGNLCDRIFNGGYVHDFIEFEYFGLTIFNSRTFAIFNFADSFLTVGVIIFAVYFIFYYKPDPKKEKTEVNTDGGENIDGTVNEAGTAEDVVIAENTITAEDVVITENATAKKTVTAENTGNESSDVTDDIIKEKPSAPGNSAPDNNRKKPSNTDRIAPSMIGNTAPTTSDNTAMTNNKKKTRREQADRFEDGEG